MRERAPSTISTHEAADWAKGRKRKQIYRVALSALIQDWLRNSQGGIERNSSDSTASEE
jgi:hypothetical protein